MSATFYRIIAVALIAAITCLAVDGVLLPWLELRRHDVPVLAVIWPALAAMGGLLAALVVVVARCCLFAVGSVDSRRTGVTP